MLLYFIFSDVFPWLVPEEGNDGDSNALMYFFLGYLWTVVTNYYTYWGRLSARVLLLLNAFHKFLQKGVTELALLKEEGAQLAVLLLYRLVIGVCGGHWLWTDVPNCSYWRLNVTVCFSFLSDQKCFKLRKTSWRCLCFFHWQLCSWNPSQYRQD